MASSAVKHLNGSPKRLYTIAMVSDFFLPSIGGLENAIYYLGVCLMRRGHRVIVITHSHSPNRTGVRHLTPGLKVYYLPIKTLAAQATLPNFLTFGPYLRNILLREHVDIVHGHGSLSSLSHEAVMYSGLFDMSDDRSPGEGETEDDGSSIRPRRRRIRSVMTDHSLFGFGDTVGILTNKLLKGAMRNVDRVICVSHTGRENTIIRGRLDPAISHVIPNSILPSQFEPSPESADPNYITIIVISRLVYRKGVDLLVASAPRICALFPDVRFIIGGDGPKMVDIEQMREKYLLQDRIELLGNIKNSDVQSVLTRGQIFLNTSLTEAFGTALLEAASTGLFVVATKVGGAPEVLPEGMVQFCEPDEEDVVQTLTESIYHIKKQGYNTWEAHNRIKEMYSWDAVAEQTEIVYDLAVESEWKRIGERMLRMLDLGPFFGAIMLVIVIVQCLFFEFLEWAQPRDEIDYVHVDEDGGGIWDNEKMKVLCEKELSTFKQDVPVL